MNDLKPPTTSDALRRALQELYPDSPANRLARASLLAGLSGATAEAAYPRSAPVTADPARKSGAPCIAGTRMTTRQVSAVVADADLALALACWPHLTPEQVRDALVFEADWGRGRKHRARVRAALGRLNGSRA